MFDYVEKFYVRPKFIHFFRKLVDYGFINYIIFFAIERFMGMFNFQQFSCRIQSNVIRFYMVWVTEQD